MSKIDKFTLFQGAMAMSGQGSIWKGDMGKHYAAYLVLSKLDEVGSKFSLSDAVEIEEEAKAYQEEFDNLPKDDDA